MFIPAILLAIHYRLYIEALVYFFNMFFSIVSSLCLLMEKKNIFNKSYFISFIMPVIKKLIDIVYLNTMVYSYQILLVHIHHL